MAAPRWLVPIAISGAIFLFNRASAAESPVCAPLAAFVNTAAVDHPVQLTVGTEWPFTKYCSHPQQQPRPAQLCEALLGTIERAFVHPAITESLSCADNLREYSLGDGNIVHRAEVILLTWELAGADDDIRVEFHYLIGSHHEMDGQWLTIRAKRVED